jgi:Flp pilus assembly pilin Flp
MMKRLTGRIGSMLRTLHTDEQGADMVEYVLIIAAIALPLVGLMIYYREQIITWVKDLWSSVQGEGKKDYTGGPG